MTAGPAAPTPASRPRVRLAPDERREQIVREATRLIARSGFNGVSLADVAGACGIRKPSVLHYFPSMSHLLVAVLDRRDALDAAAAMGGTSPRPDPAGSRELLTRIVTRNLGRRELVRLYAVLGAEALDPAHPAHDIFAERTTRVRDGIATLLAWKADPRAAAVEVLAVVQGLELEWLRTPELDVLATWNAFCDRFFATTV